MKDIKSSRCLKIISYILVPIFCAVILINFCSLMYYENYKEDFEQTRNYFETEHFATDYLNTVYRAVYNTTISRNDNVVLNNSEDILIMEENISKTEINYNLDQYITTDNYEMVIIRPDGIVITNINKTIDTDSLEELKAYVNQRSHRLIYDGAKLTTDIKKLEYNEIAYNPEFEDIKENKVQIYACVKDEISPQMYRYNLIYQIVSETYSSNAPIVITVSLICLFVNCIYIIISIGHKRGEQEIYTDGLDKIPLEIVIVISGVLLVIEVCFIKIFTSLIFDSNSSYSINMGIILELLMAVLVYLTIATAGITIIRRIKAHIFWKSTLCYKIFKWITNTANKITGELFKDFSMTVKVAIMFVGIIGFSFILLLLARDSVIFLLVLVGFWYFIYRKILNYLNDVGKIKDKIAKIYNGNVEEPLNENEFEGEFKEIAKQLNDIAGGISNAIEEAMKSERLKTELITNVSHDIKTPLTSIINYVDLMKKEKIDNPKVQEYLVILDNKSQRLKKLTEDLVEASKASSGNIKLTMEKLNVKELMKQVGGEFEGRFKEKGLKIIENFPQENVYIIADSRYMYRVLENMYINISKYALENSRVYVDVVKEDQKIEIVLKNISRDKLNISVDELMQRFVRGDSARTTEGSGLGISIAKSLTELQKGKFDIYLDGDLFKVVLEFKVN